MLVWSVLLFSMVVIVVAIALCMQSDSPYVKLLLVNFSTNLLVLFIVAMGTYSYNIGYIDIALIYLCLSFVAMKGFLRYFTK